MAALQMAALLVLLFNCLHICFAITGGLHLAHLQAYVSQRGGTCSTVVVWKCTIPGYPTLIDLPLAAMALQLGVDPPRAVPINAWPPDNPELFQAGRISGYEQPLRHLRVFPYTSAAQLGFRFYGCLPTERINPITGIVEPTANCRAIGGAVTLDLFAGQQQYLFLIHDWLEDWTSMQALMEAYVGRIDLKSTKIAVIFVDWSNGAQLNTPYSTFMQDGAYTQAAANTLAVGRLLGQIMFAMKQAGWLHQEHVIGVGLGAQVAHFAADYIVQETLNEIKLTKITALDPIAFDFQNYREQFINADNWLSAPFINKNDATFVEVIHTSAVKRLVPSKDDIINGRIGMSLAVGHSDFYPHGGQWQPFCAGSPIYMCHHSMAMEYYIESFKKPFREFLSSKSTSYNQYVLDAQSNRLPVLDQHDTQNHHLFNFMGRGSFDNEGIFYNHVLLGSSKPTFQSNYEVLLEQPFNPLLIRPQVNLPHFAPTSYPADRLTSEETTSNCGLYFKPDTTQIARVIHGGKTQFGMFPWTVCIQNRIVILDTDPNGTPTEYRRSDLDLKLIPESRHTFNFTPDYGVTCTGFIIDEWHVVTAAHCFHNSINGADMYLMFGGTSCTDPVEFRHVVIEQRRGNKIKTTVFMPQSLLDAKNIAADPTKSKPKSLVDFDYEDIAIIRIYGKPLDLRMPWEKTPSDAPANPRQFLNKICYKSSTKIADNGLYKFGGEYIYYAGYGFKGKTETLQRTPPYELTWLQERVGSGYILSDINGPRYWVSHRARTYVFPVIDDTVSARPLGWSGRSTAFGDSGGAHIQYIKHGQTFTNAYTSQLAESKGVAVGIVSSGPREYDVFDDTLYINVNNSAIRGLPQLQASSATNMFRQLPFIARTLFESAVIGHEGPPKVRSSSGHMFYVPSSRGCSFTSCAGG